MSNVTVTPGYACGLFFRSFRYMVVMEKLLIAGFVKKNTEAKTWALSGETTEGQASPLDCHKTAKLLSDEDIFIRTGY